MSRIRNAFEKVKNSTFFVSVFKVGSGQLIAQIFSLISVPILSRIYSDVAYGDTALITSTAAILTNISTIGLTSAIMKPREDEEAKKVFTTAFLTNFLICTGFTAVYAFLIGKKQLFAISGSYGFALLLMWLYCILTVTTSLMLVYLNRKQKYNKLFFNPIIGAASNFVVAIPLGMMGFGFEGFMITYIIEYMMICIHMMWKDVPFSSQYRPRDFIRVLVEYKEYILFQFPSNSVSNFANEYPTQYFGRAYTSQELGGYSMCERILKIPVRLIASPISTVYFRTASEFHREGKNLAEFTYQMVSRILLISVLPVAIFMFISEPLFVFVLGEKWREAGTLAAFLIIQYVLMFCSQTTTYCRVSIGRQRTNLIVSVLQLAFSACFCFAGYAMFHTMRGTVIAYSVGQCMFSIVDLAISFYCMNKQYLKKFLAVSAGYTVLMYAFLVVKCILFP